MNKINFSQKKVEHNLISYSKTDNNQVTNIEYVELIDLDDYSDCTEQTKKEDVYLYLRARLNAFSKEKSIIYLYDKFKVKDHYAIAFFIQMTDYSNHDGILDINGLFNFDEGVEHMSDSEIKDKIYKHVFETINEIYKAIDSQP